MLYRLLLSLPSLVFKGHPTAKAFLASLFRRDNRLWYVPSQGGLLAHSTKTDSYRYHVHMRRPVVTRKPTHISNLKVVVIHSQVLHRKREQFAGMRVFFFHSIFLIASCVSCSPPGVCHYKLLASKNGLLTVSKWLGGSWVELCNLDQYKLLPLNI